MWLCVCVCVCQLFLWELLGFSLKVFILKRKIIWDNICFQLIEKKTEPNLSKSKYAFCTILRLIDNYKFVLDFWKPEKKNFSLKISLTASAKCTHWRDGALRGTYLKVYVKLHVFLQLLVETLLVIVRQFKCDLSPRHHTCIQQQQTGEWQIQHRENKEKVQADRLFFTIQQWC